MRQKFEFVDMGDEIVAVPVGENAGEMRGVLKVNKEGKEILSLLEEQKDENTIIDTLSKKYDTDRAIISEYVLKFMKQIKDIGIIE